MNYKRRKKLMNYFYFFDALLLLNYKKFSRLEKKYKGNELLD
jgi:hypothetical protein